jgi:predicted ATPase
MYQTRDEQSSHGRPITGALIAEAETAAGRYDVALATIETELEMMPQTGLCYFLADAHRVRGEILLKSNPADTEAAELAFTRAIEIARGQSAKRLELRAAMCLSQLLTDQRKCDEQGLLAILVNSPGERLIGWQD